MKDLRHAMRILGMEILKNITVGNLFVSQERYILNVLDKLVKTPLGPQFKFSVVQASATQ